jgi:hypothetical protein
MPNPNIKPLSHPRFVRMAMVAPSGFGKTVFAGTAPNALFVTTDPEGTASAAAFGSTAQEWQVTDQQGLRDAYTYLEQGGIKELGLEWVIVDNLTEAQAIFMARAMEIAVERKPDRSPFVPDKHEYLVAQNATVDMVKKFITLPVNLIFTVHRKGMEDGDANTYYSAAIQGGQGEIAQKILGYMNVVGMGDVLTIGDPPKEVRRIYFDHVREFRGKDRFVRLGKFRDDMTVSKMMSILYPDGQEKGVVSQARPRPRPRG